MSDAKTPSAQPPPEETPPRLAAATRFELAMHRHMRALKYGYNLDQPRAGISIRGMELLPRSLKGSHRAIT